MTTTQSVILRLQRYVGLCDNNRAVHRTCIKEILFLDISIASKLVVGIIPYFACLAHLTAAVLLKAV